ncbi:MAG: tRNA (adenosine(37)-N6)-threonylcarbamoyltransferase complex transferase subunit TsaD [Clostridia bacterium]|nr:tRNA (adenosine(37)-N6)-threonylcarbamoyltransferase complex transferase subunit TsaD [Clostridia bacterium]
MDYFEKINQLPIKENPIILGIESSCDETAAALVQGGRVILAQEIISSSVEQAKYGGVVPEIASRAHTDAVSDAVNGALKKAGLKFSDIDAIAVTYGAGLLGALLVGLSYAKALAFSLSVPLIGVSHIRGHMAAAYLADTELKPPFIGLLASGGHTAVTVVEDYQKLKLLGGTLDDAVGEAFDKVARVLGLSYPGGPNVENLAKQGQNNIALPKMLKGLGGYNFSYSGLKTAVINYKHQRDQKGEDFNKADLACSFQSAALDILVDKAIEAATEYSVHTIAVGGGVAANGYLREQITKKCANRSIKVVLPPKPLCTDNAAMIAAEGYIKYVNREFSDLTLNAKAQVSLV